MSVEVCAGCGTVNEDSARFCVGCGNSLPTGCPRCGAQIPEGARFCPSCGHSLAAPPLRLEERKLVTILFADVTGSTALGEQLDPERIRMILAEYFASIESVVREWGGSVEKFIGDAVMAAFGVPTVKEDDAQRALHAALEILTRMEGLNDRFEKLHQVRLVLRLGINTGDVIAPVGERVEQLIVAGDAVNVAARLQGAAEPGTILVGERTYNAARGAFRFSDPVNLELKGKSEPVTARRLLGAHAGYERGNPDLRAPLVGRDLELLVLSRLLNDVVARSEPRMAIVYGPAGIGKTRLTKELVESAAASGEPPRVVRGRCLAVGAGITYWALAEILRNGCGIGLDDSAGSVRQKLTQRIDQILTRLSLPPPDAQETLGALAATAGIELEDDPLRALEPKAMDEAIARAWPRFVSALSAEGPLVVVIEDLHWADDRLVETLGRILARSSGPILFVATARPEFAERHPGFGAGREGVTTIQLSPLTDEASARLVAELLPLQHFPQSLRAAILDRAEGNPFFIEEILQRLIEQGVLVRGSEGWRATDTATPFLLPDSVHALLAARIDALPAAEKIVLQEAAVVGRVFWAAPLRLRVPGVDVGDALLGLESRGLILARPLSTIAGESEYAFRHALVRDVAYAGLPRSRRARAHASVAVWTERLAADRLDEFGELVAHHYWTAVAGEDTDLAWAEAPEQRELLRAKAFASLLQAGAVARRRYALTAAVDLHLSARDLAVGDQELFESSQALGDDHAAAYHGDQAVAAYLSALQIARARPELADQRAPLVVKLAREAVMKSGTFLVSRKAAEVEAWIAEGLAAQPDPKVRGWLLALQAGSGDLWSENDAGDPKPITELIAAGEEALASARRLGHPGLEAYAGEVLMQLYESGSAFDKALDLARQRLALSEVLDAPSAVAALLFESALVIGEVAGDWEHAMQLGQRARAIAVHLSSHELMHTTGTILTALFNLGRWDEADAILVEHLAAFDGEANVRCSMVRNGPAIGALIHAYRGELEKAKALLELVPPADLKSGTVDGTRALVEVISGNVGAGLALAQAVLNTRLLRVHSYGNMALFEARTALNQWDDLAEDLARAAAYVPGSVLLGTVIDRFAGIRWAALGNQARSADHLHRSLSVAESHGLAFAAAQARQTLAAVTEKPPTSTN